MPLSLRNLELTGFQHHPCLYCICEAAVTTRRVVRCYSCGINRRQKECRQIAKSFREQNSKFVRAPHPNTICKIRSEDCCNLHTYTFVGPHISSEQPPSFERHSGLRCLLHRKQSSGQCLLELSFTATLLTPTSQECRDIHRLG